ncbi:receptor-like protein kinase HERK 1 [Lactuca sativa]|uniref:receptor-like protein kinase HERK 1 n=1 Tax=Lactuca sativa TaxID=4236 RepID=UPI0022AFC1A5|nr:receptor-like protein kinase HERK 1 [Lactuca sativa]XP_052627675.1 receptor-like protein kinase HERK 1 [Lactuca sativa]
MSVPKMFEHLRIPLEAIRSATNDFAKDNCIGEGGLGKVYKGELLLFKGRTKVALKRLDRIALQRNREFWMEIMMLSQYRHENIVSFLGFCDEKDEKILVYEYASNNSLDLHLDSKDLTWVQRLSICIGAARGLEYLHDPAGSQQRKLHRDVKSANILLDENWNASIADLGLSTFHQANTNESVLSTNPVGTMGYCDPSYMETGMLTKESDVYSLGVVLFEVLCGRLCIQNNNRRGESFIHLDEINPDSLRAFATIAYQCLNSDYEKRPSMNDVVKNLEDARTYQLKKTQYRYKKSEVHKIEKSNYAKNSISVIHTKLHFSPII